MHFFFQLVIINPLISEPAWVVDGKFCALVSHVRQGCLRQKDLEEVEREFRVKRGLELAQPLVENRLHLESRKSANLQKIRLG